MDYIKIFEDTLKRSSENFKSCVYLENDFIFEIKYIQKYVTKIEIIDEDCLITAQDAVKLQDQNSEKICLLNFASELQPGGGVKKVKGSQEEEICRRTDLFKNIIKFENLYYFNILKNTSKDKKKLF